MQITIHRGIDQIGGCITEISTARSKILIDLGHNLPKGDKPAKDDMDNPEFIRTLCKGCDAIFYTHYHGDHVDLFRHVPDHVPQYIGSLAKQVMHIRLEQLTHIPEEKEQHQTDVALLDRFRTYETKQRIPVGQDIWITPYFVSHSAADAYMFLVEADEKCVLHTGDFRGHGYLSKGLIPMLQKYIVPKDIDVLICEGTMLAREDKNILCEYELKVKAVELMQRYKNVFVLCSSTDIDRLATFHAANKQMHNRPFVCDSYQQKILNLFTATAGQKSNLYKFDQNVIGSNENNVKLRNWMMDKGFTMLVRKNDKYRHWVESLLPHLNPAETVLIYSMFQGYILPTHTAFTPSTQTFVNMFPKYVYLHTSGHATTDVLTEVCQTVNPRTAIIPIHREKNTDFAWLAISDRLRSRIVTSSQIIDGIRIKIEHLTDENQLK